MEEKEPTEVFVAFYDHEAYGCDGDSEVYYRRGRKYYHNSGSHCSCHGLEDQWQPIEYGKRDFIGFLERYSGKYSKEVLAMLRSKSDGNEESENTGA